MPGHVFISYVREDSQAIDRLQHALQTAGIRVWRDTSDLWPGEDWRLKIRRAIVEDTLIFIACFSEHSAARATTMQREEIMLAVDEFRRRRSDRPWLLPVRLSDVRLPSLDLGAGQSLDDLQWLDLFGDQWDRGVARLVGTIRPMLDPDTTSLSHRSEEAPVAKGNATAERAPHAVEHQSPGQARPIGQLTPVTLPPGLAARFEVVGELPTIDANARVLVVDEPESGQRRMLRFHREGAVLSSDLIAALQTLAKHDDARQHVATVYETGAEAGRWFEVHEYSALGSLRAVLESHAIDALALAAELGRALSFLEGRLILRSLSPENLTVRSLDPLDVVVSDFGLVRAETTGSVRWSVRGVPAYEPPEAAANRLTVAWDWWSAGMIVAEVALGRHPLADEAGWLPSESVILGLINRNPIDLSGIEDVRLALLCRGLLAPDPSRRWHRPQVLAWLAGETPEVPSSELSIQGEESKATRGPTNRLSVRDGRASPDRVVDVVAYLGTSDPDQADAILARIEELFVVAGGSELMISSVEEGSFFVKLRGLLSGAVSRRELRDRLAKLERGVELRLLDHVQAEVTDTTAKAFAAVKAELADIDVACIRIESLLVLKYPNAGHPILLVRTLSQPEIRALERYPELQMHPENLLEALSTIAATDIGPAAGLRPTASDD